MGDVVGKIVEHIRQVHFVFLFLLFLLSYGTIATIRERPKISNELEKLIEFQKELKAVSDFAGAKRPLARAESDQLFSVLNYMNKETTLNARTNFQRKMTRKLFVQNNVKELDRIVFCYAPERFLAPTLNQPLSAVLLAISKINFTGKINVDFNFKEGVEINWAAGTFDHDFSQVESVDFDDRLFEARLKIQQYTRPYSPKTGSQARGAGPVTVSKEVAKGEAHNINLTLIPKDVSISTSTNFLPDHFPQLLSLPPAMQEKTVFELINYAKAADEKALEGRHTKIFDVEIQGRDVCTVVSAAITGIMLYLYSFLHQAVVLIKKDSDFGAMECNRVSAIWVGLHSGLARFILLDLGLIGANVFIFFSTKTFYGLGLISGSLVFFSLFISLVLYQSINRLRDLLHETRKEVKQIIIMN